MAAMAEQNAQHYNTQEEVSLDVPETKQLNGLLARYQDDQISVCVNSALKRKSRVRYKCMDTYSNLLAFGTSAGAVYLFKLKTITHSSCVLSSRIPCDQGPIEVIKFLPNPIADDLLVAIGTTRGSLIIFRLTQLPGDQNPYSQEVYRAESFTQGSSIKLIEFDQDLLDPFSCSLHKLYICDLANRLYLLDTSSIYSSSSKQTTLRLFYSNFNLPSLIFSVNDSDINQISVHKSQLLISTDETTRFFNEQTGQLSTIGRKPKRRRGFYGSCFFNPNYKPMRILQMQPNSGCNMSGRCSRSLSQQTSLNSSSASLNDLENLLIFVARPSFRLWQVNNKREVMFTHQFEPMIRTNGSQPPIKVAELQNEPLNEDESDHFQDIARTFRGHFEENKLTIKSDMSLITSDHFEKLLPIYSPTLGNLLLSYGRNEVFIVDPIEAKLIVWHHQERPIIQVSCIENEIFIWSSANERQQQTQYHIDRLVLLAPAQFILELHRIHRYLSLMYFVQLFNEQFRCTMTLPLTHKSEPITVEGGLLRNILLSTWDSHNQCNDSRNSQLDEDDCSNMDLTIFKQIVDDIVEESRQLKQSIENLSDSRFLLAMTNENIERLCSEPYTSLISLQVSIANLHTNHVINFSKDALNRHKSMANLSAQMQNLPQLKAAQSTMQLHNDYNREGNHQGSINIEPVQREVIVERQKPLRRIFVENANQSNSNNGEKSNRVTKGDNLNTVLPSTTSPKVNELRSHEAQEDKIASPFFSAKGRLEAQRNKLEELSELSELSVIDSPSGARHKSTSRVDFYRCAHCQWPRARSHLKPMHSSQQIQLNWLQDNLMGDFKQNIDSISEHAFKHGLWHLFMKCLIHQGKLEDYLTCCILLDDVRLLVNVELDKVNIVSDEKQYVDEILDHLGRKMEFLAKLGIDLADANKYCYKCGCSLENIDDLDPDDTGSDLDYYQQENDDMPDDIKFDLINLFEQLSVKRGADINGFVSSLSKHKVLLKHCKIPAKFYLKIISTATLAASQRNILSSRTTSLIKFERFKIEPNSNAQHRDLLI